VIPAARLRRRGLIGAAAALAAALVGAPRRARADLPLPEGPVVLTVTGAVDRANDAAGAVFDDRMLGALPQVAFDTATLWTPRTRFEGPALRTVLDAAGAAPGRVEALALNDYRAPIDRALIEAASPIVARRIDGRPFGVRALGPLWIMFPFDDRPELRLEAVYMQCVWQLHALRVGSG
jgi:hypothetical protein